MKLEAFDSSSFSQTYDERIEKLNKIIEYLKSDTNENFLPRCSEYENSSQSKTLNVSSSKKRPPLQSTENRIHKRSQSTSIIGI